MAVKDIISQKFPKQERLCSSKRIQELFNKGSLFYEYPLKLIFIKKSTPPSQILIAVPKKKIPKAVSRNKLRRRLKEAYRQQKHLLTPSSKQSIFFDIAILYTSKEVLPYSLLKNKLKNLLERLSNVQP